MKLNPQRGVTDDGKILTTAGEDHIRFAEALINPPQPNARLARAAKAHKRAGFTCGNDRIDSYFHETVSQDVKRNNATCFVAREIATDRVAGFSTLSSSNVPLTKVRFRPAGRGRSAWSAKRSQMFIGLRRSEPR